VFEDQLFLVLGLKHDGILVKTAYVPRNLSAVQQMHRYVLARCKRDTQKRFLNIDD